MSLPLAMLWDLVVRRHPAYHEALAEHYARRVRWAHRFVIAVTVIVAPLGFWASPYWTLLHLNIAAAGSVALFGLSMWARRDFRRVRREKAVLDD